MLQFKVGLTSTVPHVLNEYKDLFSGRTLC